MYVRLKTCSKVDKIIFKTSALDGSIYQFFRFTAWTKKRTIEEFYLPRIIQEITGQSKATIGDAVLALQDTVIGYEICEELWNPESSHIDMSLDGVEIFVNGSGSYMELRKAYVSVDLVKSATAKCGGMYLFSNLRGCDGERVYFNGNDFNKSKHNRGYLN